jgi:hypothetical protein
MQLPSFRQSSSPDLVARLSPDSNYEFYRTSGLDAGSWPSHRSDGAVQGFLFPARHVAQPV